MPCIDSDFKNCPAYMELGDGERCPIQGCLRQKNHLGYISVVE